MDEPERVQPYEIPENTTPLSNPLGKVSDVDWTSPNIARMYDYFLGGAANFAVDRVAADEFLDALAGNRLWTLRYTRGNRAFLGRAVRYLAGDVGIDQFLDLGSGVPTVGNVHEIAQQVLPAARVAYVDREPVAVHHTRRLLPDSSQVTATQADVREPEAVLNSPGVAQLLDFTRPVAVLAVGILDLLGEEDEPDTVVQGYHTACSSGSALVLSHAVQHAATAEQVAAFQTLMAQTSTPQIQFRSVERVAELHAGYELVAPGLVPFDQWHPQRPVTDEEAAQANGYGAVGLLP